MKYGLLVRKLLMRKERYITDAELKQECAQLKIPYLNAIKYLYVYKYLTRIVRGFFYIPTIEERKLHTGGPSVYEAVARAMEYKKVKNWYFGLETAIKWSGITHEVFTIHYVISDTIFRSKPIKTLGTRVHFIKLKKDLFGFGIKKTKNRVPYSDLEKTLVDMAYLRKQRGQSEQHIRDYVIEWFDEANKKKIKKYAKHYPKSVQKLMKELK